MTFIVALTFFIIIIPSTFTWRKQNVLLVLKGSMLEFTIFRKVREVNFLHFILNESKCGNARISSGMHVFIMCILYLLLLLCMPYFFWALGDVAGLARCCWAGRSSQPMQHWALGLFCPLGCLSCFLQIQCLSFNGDRKSKLSGREDGKSLCAWDSTAGKPRSQSLLTRYRSGLRFWLQTSQFDMKCVSDLSAQKWGSSGCSDLSLLAHRPCSEALQR